MGLKVPYLPDAEIEASATTMLTLYSMAEAVQVRPPIDLDDLLVHLGLRLDFDDLKTTPGNPDALGALWVKDQHIYIDQTLDPDERPGALSFHAGARDRPLEPPSIPFPAEGSPRRSVPEIA